MNNAPQPIPPDVWNEIARIPDVSEGYGIDDIPEHERGSVLADSAYGAVFEDFATGGPGYIGPLYIVQGDGFGAGPQVFTRGRDGRLELTDFGE